jgi:hypothetical protein
MTRRLAALLATLLLAGACTPTEGPTVPRDALFTAILDLRARGASAPLRDLTDFRWDTVYCYYEGTPNDEINAEVGSEAQKPGGYLLVSGALAVFVADGEIVRTSTIPELTFTKGRQPPDVVVRNGSALVAG